jgi:hypothetical protein
MIHKRLKHLALLVVLMFSLSGLVGCSTGTTATKSVTTASAVTSSQFTKLASYSSTDLNSSWDASSATKITLNGSSAVIDGSGASASNGTVTITAAGTYVLNGTLKDGQIIVAAAEKDKVHLVLNGVKLSCSDSAPVYVKQADKVIVTLAKGTTNSVTDGSSYTLASGEDEPNAAVFSKSDLTINGSGTLTVDGNYKNGIVSKDDLLIISGDINVTAVNDGIRGKDSVAVKDGNLTIKVSGDGIQANNDKDTDKGWIELDGGTFNIVSQQDAIQAETILQVNGGTFSLTTGGGSASVSKQKGKEMMPGGNNNTTTTEEDTTSAKAIKGGTEVQIGAGTFTIDAADDAIHSANVTVKGGTFTISTGDDAVHADSNATIDAGTIKIDTCYEGLEGAKVTVNGGNIHLTASDDGLNAAGGNDGSGQQGGDQFAADDNCEIRITGGYIYVDAQGDGLDSNGSLYITGGTAIVNGPTNNGNGALDYNGTAEITGGILVAAGSSGMAQAPGTSSSQNSLLVYYTSAQAAGTLVNLSDADGNSLLTFTPSKTYQSIVISLPTLKQGQTYTLSSGGCSTGKNVDGLYSGGTYSGGTKLTDVKISSAVTSISDDGSAVTGHNAAGGGPGGGQGGGSGGQGGRPDEGQGGGPGGQRPTN